MTRRRLPPGWLSLRLGIGLLLAVALVAALRPAWLIGEHPDLDQVHDVLEAP